MKKRMSMVAIAAAALSLAVSAQAAGQDPIKVGLIAPFSGPFADYGKQMEGGIKAYMAQYGSTVAGKKVEILVRDSTGPAPEIAKRLAQDVNVILEAAAGPPRERGVEVVAHPREGDPADAILSVAEETQAERRAALHRSSFGTM